MSYIEKLLDNAACCSQDRGMLDDGVLRKCVRLNVAEPLTKEIERLTAEVSRLSEAMKESHTLVPSTWLDDLLSGPNKLPFDGDCRQLQAILQAVKNRIERHTITALSGSPDPDVKMTYSEKDGLNVVNGRQEQNDG